MPEPNLHIAIQAEGSTALRSLLFRPLVHYALDLALNLPRRSLAVLAGGMEAQVRAACREYPALEYFDSLHALMASRRGSLLVLAGDAPLLRASSVREMLAQHGSRAAAFTFEADAGAYLLVIEPFRDAADLSQALSSGAPRGLRIERFRVRDAVEATRVRDSYTLWQAESAMRERVNHAFLRAGVGLRDPNSSFIDARCRIAAGVEIEPGTTLVNSKIDADVRVEAYCRIVDSEIGAGTRIKQGSYVEGSRIGRECLIGPYAHVRNQSRLGDRVRAGNFVEIKKSQLGEGTSAAHLAYVGDAQVGQRVNIGCGFITCNSDGGPVKQRTVIEDDVFIGSDSQAVAPVHLGAGSFIATGTTVVDDVPPEAFAISRGRQVTKLGYARKFRRSKAAEREATQASSRERDDKR